LLDEAYTHLRELADKHPTNDYADDALYWAGYAAFKAGDYEKAVLPWSTLANKFSSSDLANFGGYWQAKSLLALGRDDEAQAVLKHIAANSRRLITACRRTTCYGISLTPPAHTTYPG